MDKNKLPRRRNARYLLRSTTLLTLFLGIFGLVAIYIGIQRTGIFTSNQSKVPYICASSDGEQLVFNSTDGDLYILDRKSGKVAQITNTELFDEFPTFSPDEQDLAFDRFDTNYASSIYIRSMQSGLTRKVTDEPDCRDISPAYSPDGKQIAFARAHLYRNYSMGGKTWDQWDVYLMNADGSDLRRMTTGEYYNINKVQFSPDGQAIYYSATVSTSNFGDSERTIRAIHVVDGKPFINKIATPFPERGSGGAWKSELSFSSSTPQCIFISDRNKPFHYDVIVQETGSGKYRPLKVTGISRYNHCPIITSDGREVLFVADPNADEQYEIWSVSTDGDKAIKIGNSHFLDAPNGTTK